MRSPTIQDPEFVKRMIVDSDNLSGQRKKFLSGQQLSEDEIRKINSVTPRYKEINWGPERLTMVPWTALGQVQSSIIDTVNNNVPGDFVETGAWRGGTCILAKAMYNSLGINKNIFVVDSFEGLPPPDPEKYPDDINDTHYQDQNMSASLETVQANFSKFGLLDDQIVFVKGWFKDTMPTAPIDKISILRLDGDMYESTIDVLVYLYHKLSVGGYCIIDDYQHPACRAAVQDFRAKHRITEEIIKVDSDPLNEVHYWIKQKQTKFIQNDYPRRGLARFLDRIAHTLTNLVK